ncbi:MAG TPA: rhomboid family intramembrane serine protease [Stellaceae bacterium]|nr:rhomboid family intramembrane serine protease [Stellaceae bacterium]
MIFAIPLYDDNPTRRPPYVTLFMIGACTGAFLWELGQDPHEVALSYGMIPGVLFGYARLASSLQVLPPWATIFTSMFLHGGWLHLIGNMLFLWIFGNNLEDALGRVRYAVLYFASGIAAALAQAAVNVTSHLPMIGASGAIAGVLGAYLMMYPRANVHCFIWIIIFFRIVTVPAWILLGLWFGVQLLNGLGSTPATGGVAFWAHVGGFASGVLLVMLLRPSGISLFQPPKSLGFAAVRPGDFAGRTTFHHGSVPAAGRRLLDERPPWRQ